MGGRFAASPGDLISTRGGGPSMDVVKTWQARAACALLAALLVWSVGAAAAQAPTAVAAPPPARAAGTPPAKLVGSAAEPAIALIKADPPGPPAIPLGSSSAPRVAEPVMAI